MFFCYNKYQSLNNHHKPDHQTTRQILRAAASTTSTTSCLAPSAAGRQAEEEQDEGEGEAWVDAKARHLRRALHEVCRSVVFFVVLN
jgi:hypothetical protein